MQYAEAASFEALVAADLIIDLIRASWKPIEVDGSGFREWEIERRNEFFRFLSQYKLRSLTVSEAGRLWREGGYEPYFLNLPDLLGSYRSPLNPLRHFWLVTLPLAISGIIASLIAVWARAAAEWEALMLFVGGIEGQTDVLAFAVYLDWNGGMMGWVVSMSLVCVFLAIAAMGAMHLIGRKSYVW